MILQFQQDNQAIMLAHFGQMKVVSVYYRTSFETAPDGFGSSPVTQADITGVYRELLKTHSPSQIGAFGLSGGGQLASHLPVWLEARGLPLPGALGLITPADGRSDYGNSGDTLFTLAGLDTFLSTAAFSGFLRLGPPDRTTLLDKPIPKGYPPTYIMAGTRDMCLSMAVLLHRRLRNSGVEVDLNIFDGLWHGATLVPGVPEAEEFTKDFASFLDKHLSN
ncbi:MAG: alpha/beta hydrolase [Hyphomonadaceae bacterium]|nr:alpha/beta hydrolase [Hyphomonadaceae bacterium]